MTTEELFEKINKRFDTLEQGQKQLREETVSKDEFQTIKENTVTKVEFQKATKQTNRKLNKIQKGLELVLKYHDENVIRLRGRIERLEEHTGLTTPHKN